MAHKKDEGKQPSDNTSANLPETGSEQKSGGLFGMNRRKFLKLSGFAAAGAGMGSMALPPNADAQDDPTVPGLRMVIPPMAGQRETAVQYYGASEHAQMIADYWAQQPFNLQVELQRAKMFEIPGGSTRKTGLKDAIYALQVLVGVRPPGFMKPVVESKSSLIGESAYSAFLNDTFINGYNQCDPNDTTCEPAVPARFSSDKVRMLGDPSRMNMSSDIGKLIDSGLGGAIPAATCCCCCCCCSACCCSSNDGDQQGGDVKAAAVPHGDPQAGNLPETELYYRGMMAVMPNGEAVGVILHGRSSDMAVDSMSIAYVDATVGEVKQVSFDPNRLVEIGPEAMAKEIFR